MVTVVAGLVGVQTERIDGIQQVSRLDCDTRCV